MLSRRSSDSIQVQVATKYRSDDLFIIMYYILPSHFFLCVVFFVVCIVCRRIDTVVVLSTKFPLLSQKKKVKGSLFCIPSTALAPYLTAINLNGSRNASSLIISNLIPVSGIDVRTY